MLWLPPIEHEDRHWYLPLSECAAAYFVYRRLVREDGHRRPWSRKALSRLLLCDPAFCVWSLWHEQLHRAAQPPQTFRCLATWLQQAPVDQWLPQRGSQFWKSTRSALTSERCMRLATRAVSSVISAGPRRWDRQPTALPCQLQHADRWFVPRRAVLRVLPIPEQIRNQICRAGAGGPQPGRRTPLPAKYRRWIRQTWSQPAVTFRQLLVASLSAPATSSRQGVSPDAERLAALRQLAYGASHEINNPLANISTRAQLMMRLTDDPELLKHLAAVNRQAFRAHEMIADLMLFAKPPQLQYSLFDMAEVVRRVIEQASQECEQRRQEIQIRQRLRSVSVQADAVQLTVAIQAIVRNAIEALQDQGLIWIELTCSTGRRRPKRVKLRIRDSGPGLTEEARQHLFDPFYSGREFGRGLGFGLTKAWTILHMHRGSISVRSPDAGGTEFVMYLPCN